MWEHDGRACNPSFVDSPGTGWPPSLLLGRPAPRRRPHVPDVQTITLVVLGILGGIGTWWSRRQLRKAGLGELPVRVAANLRDLADGWEARYDLEHENRVMAEDALKAVKLDQVLERQLAAQCRRDLDDALSQIRVLERRRRPRAGA